MRDNLLFYLTARRELTWKAFKTVFNTLCSFHTTQCHNRRFEQRSPALLRWEVSNSLDSLGHCEIRRDEGKISIAPPMLVRLPTAGLPCAVLAGGRSPATVAEIKEAVRSMGTTAELSIRTNAPHLPLIPNHISVQVSSSTMLQELSTILGVRYSNVPPAWSLLHLAGNIDQYINDVEWVESAELNWERQDFNLQSLSFRYSQAEANRFRLSRYVDPVRGTFVYYLWDRERRALVDPSWGMFALLRERSVNIIMYDPRYLSLTVESALRLPRIIARAVTLCSGLVGNSIEKASSGSSHTSKYKVGARYIGVPLQIATVAAERVGQQLITT